MKVVIENKMILCYNHLDKLQVVFLINKFQKRLTQNKKICYNHKK